MRDIRQISTRREAMIKSLAFCLAVVMLCYVAFVGHYYYQTFSTFSGIQHSQEIAASDNPAS
jgi:hypothetical protein